MLPIAIVVGALFIILYVASGSRTVKLPAMTPGRKREILDGRYEDLSDGGPRGQLVGLGPLGLR